MNATMTAPAQETAPVMSVKDWLITSLIMIVPLVNIVMLFVWAFGDGTNPNKSNWAKAALLMSVIAVGFYILVFMMIGAAFLSASA